MRREPPDNTLGCLIWIMLLIPVGIYYLLKWIVAGIATLCYSIAASRKQKSISADFTQVDNMNGHDFEYFVADILRKNGYRDVVVTKGSGDFGVDITAKKDKKRWAFQCKCYHSKLGVRPIQEVYGGLNKYNASIGVVVTNTYFTSHAHDLADNLGVLLWDRDKLATLMSAYDSKNSQPVPEIPATVEQTVISSQLGVSSELEVISSEGFNMATTIGAGKYVFGEDLPLGKYDLKVISGKGMLKIQIEDDDESWMNFGRDTGFANDYHGLSLPQGWYFSLDGNLQVEITKSKMLEIE